MAIDTNFNVNPYYDDFDEKSGESGFSTLDINRLFFMDYDFFPLVLRYRS